MRARPAAACAFALAALPGCASGLARMGTDVGALRTRDDVRARLGAPDSAEVGPQGAIDRFHLRRPIDDRARGNALFMASGMSAFLAEPFLLVGEAGRLVWTLAAGRDLRVTYDAADQVRSMEYDGETLWLVRPGPDAAGP